MTRTLDRRPEIGLDSFDRFFPNQDTMPKGGFGNLIALPLQKEARAKNHSIFLDENMAPYADIAQSYFATRIFRKSGILSSPENEASNLEQTAYSLLL
ncbi:MAG: hypothetical protein FWH22_03510 [Fibromonadales bacterium]|nr:hypothetical protein [Fibromonadales bacterium]